MRLLAVSLAKDLRRIARDPAGLLISVMIPLFVGAMIKLVSGDGAQPKAILLVTDHDDTFLSRFFVGGLGQGPLEDLIVPEAIEEAEGRSRLEAGKASGLLIIPDGFADSVFDREPATLTLLTNPSQRILPGILEETLSTFVTGINLAGMVLSNNLSPVLNRLRNVDGVPADALVAEVSVSSNQLMRRIEPYLLPPAIQVKTVNLEEPAEDAPQRGFGDIFFPSMFFLAVVFVAQSQSDDVWKERVRGTLRRALTTPGRLTVFFLGKILASGVFLFGVCATALLVARFGLGLPFQGILLAVVWATFSGMFMLLLFTLLQVLAGSQRGGNLLTNAITFPLVMAGGAFFPFEVMPAWLASIGRWTPNGWALLRFREILDGNTDPGLLGLTFVGLLGISAMLYLITVGRLRRFAQSA